MIFCGGDDDDGDDGKDKTEEALIVMKGKEH